MSTLIMLTCSTRYLTRISLSQINKTTTGCLSAGVISLNKNFSTSSREKLLTYPTNCNFRINTFSPLVSIFPVQRFNSRSEIRKDDNVKEKGFIPGQDQHSVLPRGSISVLPKDPQVEQSSDVKEISDAQTERENIDELIFGKTSHLTQFGKFKLMYKKYWYVLIPVHVVTSVSWIAGFYYLSKSGVDIPGILQYIHISESIIEKVKHSDMGHYAIAYLCYKIITPLRYAVSLGMTTISIKRLVMAGYIKPIPTKKELMEMYEQKKADRAKRKEEQAKTS